MNSVRWSMGVLVWALTALVSTELTTSRAAEVAGLDDYVKLKDASYSWSLAKKTDVPLLGTMHEIDLVSQDLLVGQTRQLERFHWFVRSHLADWAGGVTGLVLTRSFIGVATGALLAVTKTHTCVNIRVGSRSWEITTPPAQPGNTAAGRPRGRSPTMGTPSRLRPKRWPISSASIEASTGSGQPPAGVPYAENFS